MESTGTAQMELEKTKVLLIEENTREASSLREVLREAAGANFAMEFTDRLSKGLTRLGEGGVDLVLLSLSTENGLDAFLRVKEQAGRVPVLVLSNSEEEKVAVEAVRNGAHDYLMKQGIDHRALLQSMRHAVELKKTEEALKDATFRLEAATSRLETLANIDALTEVLNRIGLERALQSEFNRAQRQGWNLVAVMLDCDDFDRINASLGHAVGDVVLKEISGRLRETVRPTDHIARIGGDEFLLLLPDTRLAEGMLVAEKIRLSVAESPLRLASETIRVTASLGVLALPYEFCSIEEVLSLARLAIRESKLLGKNRVSSGEKHKNNVENADKEALAELTEKLRKGDCFRAVSMPLYRLKDQSIFGHEILSRGPAGAFEMPDDLFRVSCEYNLLTIVDLRCLKTCLNASLDPKFDQNTRFHVNLFPSTIIDTPIDRLLTLFPPNRKPGNFCIEISEQQFIGDPAYLRDHVAALKENGILVAIDDVGFGRSSLESLIILEPDIVKIDRKYVSGIADEPAKARLLRRLVKVVNALGAELIAEGIERKDELDLLLEIGIEFGQGWYWGKPA
ncbi:MAG: diguanylate cyclase [Candidatus Obscuribacterales bacterium]|nr:EAL domain-containing protein [Cyanobacteria bacterium SZAS LIN-5]RTL41519.1 MAG: EAL domain-containing protein [Candidatus Melainabacteria bacterium]